ncbi:hypothetical protein NLG97_g10943 [Lecanicillium saksenae]|uniref:Uncharacterized protein n=1 Tax=Lecanicillium saksenae TaxID=468837 RepID=A0ACC1QEI1_9HYPO|nr:hypothetical protein NLG97_g10943 [Lecanicillium saksenae]
MGAQRESMGSRGEAGSDRQRAAVIDDAAQAARGGVNGEALTVGEHGDSALILLRHKLHPEPGRTPLASGGVPGHSSSMVCINVRLSDPAAAYGFLLDIDAEFAVNPLELDVQSHLVSPTFLPYAQRPTLTQFDFSAHACGSDDEHSLQGNANLHLNWFSHTNFSGSVVLLCFVFCRAILFLLSCGTPVDFIAPCGPLQRRATPSQPRPKPVRPRIHRFREINPGRNPFTMAGFPSKPQLSARERLVMLLKLLTIFPIRLACNILRMLVLSVVHRMNIRYGLLSAVVRTTFSTLTGKEIQQIQPTTRQEYAKFIKYAAKRWRAQQGRR